MRKNILPVAALLIVSGWVLFYNLGRPNFYGLRDESRRARIAQEMIDSGDWIVPRLEGKATLTKPPFYYWAVMLCSPQGAVTERSARLPSAAAGLGTVLFTFLIGSCFFSRQVGFMSALILLFSNFFLHQARQAEMESMLALAVSGAVYFFFRGCDSRRRSAIWFSLCFFMLGFGMMTKGPFALLFPLVPIAVRLWGARQKKVLVSRSFLSGALVFLLVCLPWTIAVIRQYPDFLRVALWETAGRAVTGFAHREPFLFYFKKLIAMLFPWIFLLPFAVRAVFSGRLAEWKSKNAFLLLWLFGNIAWLSFMRSKRDIYLLSLMPAAALLFGSTWQAVFERAGEMVRRKVARPARAVFVAGVVLTGASFAAGNPFAANIPSIHFPKAAPFLFFAGTVMLSAVFIKSLFRSVSAQRAALAACMVLMLVMHTLYFTYTVAIANVEESGRHFYRAAARIVDRDTPLAFFCDYENYAFTFYARRPIVTLPDNAALDAFMSAKQPRYVVFKNKTLQDFDAFRGRAVYSSPFTEHRSWKGYVLVSNQ